ncbi:probable peptide/nitrate transporter At3g43790 [Actinia tenebrosa]|uniref:Probable peptide/nitrate transporter At3g43790 n=1 Tax=Actinia tenebrosa TaxID=6105 RepID=A0A6P8HZI8_ACTTE|nr:probable peptide/nitrate transporter At3g43790 [Actinia tenebrosa]
MANKLKDRIYGTLRSIVYPKGSTTLKWKELLILFFALMSTAMSVTMLFPFLPAMVKHFGKTEEETGYYAGLIASAMFFGRFLASYFWGYLADKFGRRPILIISLFLLSVSMFAFGFSTSVVMAMLTRFGVGLSMGLIGIAKAIISELCDHTNQSLGMSTLTSAYSLGLVFGPALGGFLSEVGRKYPHQFPKGSFFARFPFLLPCLVNSALLVTSMIIIYIWLSETLPPNTQRADSTKKEKVNEESKSFLLNSLKKKSEVLSVESCDETKNKTPLNEKSGNKMKNTESEVSDECDRKMKSKTSDEDSIETKEMPALSNGQHDVKDDSQISKSLDTNDKDLLSIDDRRNSKDSEQCTDSDISVKDDSKGICKTANCIEKDEPSSSECEVEAPNDEQQKIGKKENEESLRTETKRSTDLSLKTDEDKQEIKSRKCETCHTKDLKEMPSSTRENASTSARSSTKDSKMLSTATSVNSATKRSCCSCCGSTKDSNLWRILRNFNAVLILAVYSLYSLCVIGSDELFNIWGATDTRLGGLDFSTDDLGTSILVVGIVMIVVQPMILPKLERKLGAILNFQVCVMIVIFCIVTLPALRILVKSPSVLWPVLLIHLSVMRISVSGAFLSCFLLVNNSVRQDLLCSVNGLGVSLSSLFRAFAPSVGGSLFAWSISSGYKIGFPFNMNLAFIFFGFVYLVASTLSCFLSDSLNKPKGVKNKKLACMSCDNLLEAKT